MGWPPSSSANFAGPPRIGIGIPLAVSTPFTTLPPVSAQPLGYVSACVYILSTIKVTSRWLSGMLSTRKCSFFIANFSSPTSSNGTEQCLIGDSHLLTLSCPALTPWPISCPLRTTTPQRLRGRTWLLKMMGVVSDNPTQEQAQHCFAVYQSTMSRLGDTHPGNGQRTSTLGVVGTCFGNAFGHADSHLMDTRVILAAIQTQIDQAVGLVVPCGLPHHVDCP